MNIVSRRGEGVTLCEIGSVMRDLLLAIPVIAREWDEPTVAQRLFSPPTHQDEKELVHDWKTYVQPELEHLFRSSNEVVSRDLAGLEETPPTDPGLVSIPTRHIDSWLNSLNQARLVLASRNGFNDHELNMRRSRPIASAREFDLFRIHIYAFIQEHLIDAIHTADDEGAHGEDDAGRSEGRPGSSGD